MTIPVGDKPGNATRSHVDEGHEANLSSDYRSLPSFWRGVGPLQVGIPSSAGDLEVQCEVILDKPHLSLALGGRLRLSKTAITLLLIVALFVVGVLSGDRWLVRMAEHLLERFIASPVH